MGVADYLRFVVEAGASDLHLKVGLPPIVRVNGLLNATSFPPLNASDTEALALEMIPEAKASAFSQGREVDVGFTLPGVARFRVNAYRQRGVVSVAVRLVRAEIPTFEELMLPEGVARLAREHRGLVLVTGPAGTGKTTTIAAMIGWINANRQAHIITIEDPIEVIHADLKSVVEQREIGLDTASYADALRAAVRQDPDVIFIGEIRDRETVEAGIQAAETGHMVIATLHTLDAAETVNRVIDLYPPEMQLQARVALAAGLKGVVSQRLVARADGLGRVPAVEVLINTGRIAERIIDPAQTFTIPDVMAEGEYYGMQTFDQALVELVRAGTVSIEAARESASNPHDLMLALQAAQLA